MNTNPMPKPDELADKAHLALEKFVLDQGTYFGDSTDEKMVDLLAALHHLANRSGLSWQRLLRSSNQLYKADKS